MSEILSTEFALGGTVMEINGFQIGYVPPSERVIEIVTDQRYIKEPYKNQMNPRRVPLAIGDTVGKSPISRPSDLCQLWTVVGLYFNWQFGWKVTICRKGETDLHRNSLYEASAICLFKVETEPTEK